MAFLFSRHSRNKRPVGQQTRRARLHLERLEDRALLSGYVQTNLTGYQPGMAHYTDPNLNGWGMDFAPDGPFCVANTFSTGLATFYNHKGKPLAQTISVPAAPGHPFGPVGHPTGVVYNPTSDFVISANGKSAPAQFIFDTFDGLICGWNPGVDPNNAIVMVDNSQESPYAAIYTGLTIAQNSHGHNVLYAADWGFGGGNARVDMFDAGFQSLGSFTDASVAAQYPGNTPFQVENVKGQLFVTFGSAGPTFGGVVDIFDTDGQLLTPNHFAANAPGAGPLENPWAVVQAPENFGDFSNDLLIGNVEGAGYIHVYDPATGTLLGQLKHPDGTPIAIPGLWDLAFGAGNKNNGKANQLFFDAGPNAPNPAGNGLFGMIVAKGEGDGDHGDGEHGGGDRPANLNGSEGAQHGSRSAELALQVIVGVSLNRSPDAAVARTNQSTVSPASSGQSSRRAVAQTALPPVQTVGATARTVGTNRAARDYLFAGFPESQDDLRGKF